MIIISGLVNRPVSVQGRKADDVQDFADSHISDQAISVVQVLKTLG